MKRLYHMLSLLALIYFFATAGFAGFLFGTGRLNAERLDRMAAAMRGDEPKPASQPASQPAPVAQPSRAEIARLQAQREYFELAGERARREIEQRQALNQQIQLYVTRQMEELEARGKELRSQELKQNPSQQPPAGPSEGFERELELLSSVEPKRARDLLMQRKEPDVVRILMGMEPIRVKRIIDACKTESELAWAGRILTRIHETDTVTANGVDGPNASSK